MRAHVHGPMQAGLSLTHRVIFQPALRVRKLNSGIHVPPFFPFYKRSLSLRRSPPTPLAPDAARSRFAAVCFMGAVASRACNGNANGESIMAPVGLPPTRTPLTCVWVVPLQAPPPRRLRTIHLFSNREWAPRVHL